MPAVPVPGFQPELKSDHEPLQFMEKGSYADNLPPFKRVQLKESGNNFSGSKQPIQFVKLNFRKDDTISGVSNFPSRPTSNIRGSQGQHLTAYVVFEDTILSHVKDQTLAGAAKELRKYLDDILDLPGMKIKSGEYLKAYIERARTTLKDHDDDADLVGAVIDDILSIRNKVPGTAEVGTGGGHGEAGHSGILEQLETALRNNNWKTSWDEDVVSGQARASVWNLLDYDPANPSSVDEVDEIATRIVTHFKSIVSAYPNTDKWLNKREEYFTTYLEAHRDDVGMPLKKVKSKQLDAIFKKVGKEL